MDTPNTPEEILKEGLQKTFTGQSHHREGLKAQVLTTQYSSTFAGNRFYVDEFTGTLESTKVVGYEVAKAANGSALGRTYNGGNLTNAQFIELGITREEYDSFFGEAIRANSNTRLSEDITYSREDDEEKVWKYSYKVTSTHPLINATSGIEEVFYNGQLVGMHLITISPIEA